MNNRLGFGLSLGVAVLASAPGTALAIDSSGVLDSVLTLFHRHAATWAGYLTTCASTLFWSLVTISLVFTWWTKSPQEGIDKFFVEAMRFVVVTGFYWWALTHAPMICGTIFESFMQMGGHAAGTGAKLSPSAIVDMAFDIFQSAVDYSSIGSPFGSSICIGMALCVIFCVGSIAINMLMMLISGWVLAYAGIFFLGFGGSRWTSDIAITYYKTVLGLGAQLFGLVLVAGISTDCLRDYQQLIAKGFTLKDMAVVLFVSYSLMRIGQMVPAMLGGIVTGAALRGGDLGGNTSSAFGLAAIAGSTVSAGAKQTMETGLSVAGGATAVAAAISKASEALDMSVDTGATGETQNATGATMASTGETPFSAAAGMANDTTSEASSFGASDVAGSDTSPDTAGGAQASPSASSEPAPEGCEGATGKTPSSASDGSTASSASEEAHSGSPVEGLDAKEKGTSEQGTTMSAGRRAARVAAGATSVLAKASYGMAQEALQDFKQATRERVADTAGGRLAAAIRAGSAGTKRSDTDDEVDAFVNQGTA